MSATIQSLQEGQAQSLQNVTQLQNTEKGLYKKLEAAIAANSDQSTQQQIIDQINKVREMRKAQFGTMNSMYDSLKNNVSGTLNNFIDEMGDSIKVVQNELDKSKERLDKVEEIKNNKLRMTEINTYYGKQYKENAKTMKTIIYFCLPLIVLLVIKKQDIVPNIIINTLITIIAIVGLVIVGKRIIRNTFMRDNMNYDELIPANSSANQMGQTVVQYDIDALKGTEIEDDLKSDVSHLASKLGFACIGSSCCSSGMIFDDTEKKCVTIKPFNANVNAEYQAVSQ